MHPSSAISGNVSYDHSAALAYETEAAGHFDPVAECVAGQVEASVAGAVLEVAAGTGALTRRLDQHLNEDAHFTVTDRSPAMLETLESRWAGDHAIKINTMDYEQRFPFGDRSFDLVASQFGYLHTSQSGLDECARVLVSGGRLHLAFWGDGYLELDLLSRARQEAGLPPIEPVRTGDVEALLADAGFQVDRVTAVGFPAHFDDLETYVAYRRALGLPDESGVRRRDEEVLDIAERLMKSEFGATDPITFEWRAQIVSASLPC